MEDAISEAFDHRIVPRLSGATELKKPPKQSKYKLFDGRFELTGLSYKPARFCFKSVE